MKIYKKIVIYIFCLGGFFSNSSLVLADSAITSEVSGEITPGDFSLSKPNDLNFSAKLNGQIQTVALDTINITVTDYRGIENGWQISVKSSNFDSYKNNYQIQINNEEISNSGIVVFENENQILVKELSLSANVKISKIAKAGNYVADLEWNLQPNIKKIIKE